jgi:hypothetical protein
VIDDDVLIVSQFHYGYLVLLALLLIVFDLSVAILQQLTALADLVLQTRPFVLEANSHLPDLPVDHRFPL